MKDVFYTILVVWILWRIIQSISSMKTRQASSSRSNYTQRKQGETTVNYIPPKSKNKKDDDEGEYVDYEEIK
ncbi:MAG TPA: DUF4834 family protein [Bacteroidia bacterium]|jgi:hypothetical protein